MLVHPQLEIWATIIAMELNSINMTSTPQLSVGRFQKGKVNWWTFLERIGLGSMLGRKVPLWQKKNIIHNWVCIEPWVCFVECTISFLLGQNPVRSSTIKAISSTTTAKLSHRCDDTNLTQHFCKQFATPKQNHGIINLCACGCGAGGIKLSPAIAVRERQPTAVLFPSKITDIFPC